MGQQPLQICSFRNLFCFHSASSSHHRNPQTKPNLCCIVLPSLFVPFSAFACCWRNKVDCGLNFLALTLCVKTSSKTSRAWIIMPVLLRSLVPHLLRAGTHWCGIWPTSDVNLAAAPEGNSFSDIMAQDQWLNTETDGQRDVDPLPPRVLTFLLWDKVAIYLSKWIWMH